MAVAIRQDAYIGGDWIPGDGEEIEVRSPATGELLGTVAASSTAQVDAAVKAATDAFLAWRKVSLLERVDLCRAAFDLCMERSDEIARDDHPGSRQDDPRVARGDGRVHGRPLPPRLRGRPPPRGPGAPFHSGAHERQADHRHPGAGRGGRRGHSVELPGRHRRHPDRLRPRGRLHRRLEAVRVRPALREHVRRGHPRRGLSAGDAQRRARPRRGRLGARPSSGCRRRRLHRLLAHRRAGGPRRGAQEPRPRAGRQRARRSSSPTPTSRRPPTPPSSAASTSPASAAPQPSASSCTSP